MPKKLIVSPGDIINGWEVVEETTRTPSGNRRFIVKCSVCGRERVKDLSSMKRCKTGMCISCKNDKLFTKHGLSNNPLYFVLKDMHSRCEDTTHHKYYMYGERGIGVCAEWSDTPEGIANFVKWSEENGYKQGLVIDRVDNYKGYSPENCRWTTYAMNNFNVRRTKGYRRNNWGYEVYITYQGKMRTKTVKTEEEAIALRKQWELELYGENSPNYR